MAFNILITSSGGIRSSDLIYQIKKNSIYQPIKIHSADIKENIKARNLADSFSKIPLPKKNNYIKEIINIIKKKSIQLIIPGSDEEAVILSKAKKKLNKFGADLACVDYKYLKFFKNKISTYEKLNSTKIRKPIWKKVLNKKQMNLAVDKLIKNKKEVVIKPGFSRGGRNVTIIRNNLKKKIISKNFNRERHMSKKIFFNKEYKKYLNKFPVIVMERLFDPSYDLDLLAWNGKLIKYVLRRRIGSQGINGNIIEKNRKIFKTYAEKIAKTFNLSWLYDCDIMLDKDNKPVLMELNPRISGSLYASLAAGIPLVDDLISLSKNKLNKIKKILLLSQKKVLKI